MVNRFNKSSLHVGTELLSLGKTLYEAFNISETDYAAHGGAFPIIIKNVGIVGTITVSGLTQKEDHDMVIEALHECITNVSV